MSVEAAVRPVYDPVQVSLEAADTHVLHVSSEASSRHPSVPLWMWSNLFRAELLGALFALQGLFQPAS